MPNHSGGDLLHTIARLELSRVRTELQELLVIPLLAPHPVEANGKFAHDPHFCDPTIATYR
jgi:hypothetical protein